MMMMMMTLATNKNQKVWNRNRGMSLYKNHKKVTETFQIAIKNQVIQTNKNQNLMSMNLVQSRGLQLTWWRNLHRPQIHTVRPVNCTRRRGTVHPKPKSHPNLIKYWKQAPNTTTSLTTRCLNLNPTQIKVKKSQGLNWHSKQRMLCRLTIWILARNRLNENNNF